jgi:anti-anti-sigma factor
MSELGILSLERLDGVQVARISGEVDASNAGDMKRRLLTEIDNQAQGLVVDLTGTTYLDSAGVHLLFDLANRLRRRQQQLRVVVSAETFVADVLHTVSLEHAAAIDPELDAAVAALRPESE